jgi:hypothetical protein
MRSYEASTTIDAVSERVWSVLTDGDAYAAWDSGIDSLDGRIADGERIAFRAEVSGKRTFKVKVAVVEPGRRMTWTGGMPLGLFRGVRTFVVTPLDDGHSQFDMREEFTGPMLPLIWRSMPDLGPAFQRFAAGLKARAEATG